MIAPRDNVEFLTERPPLSLGVFTRLLRPLRALLRRFDKRNDDVLTEELSALLSDVSRCESRDDLETILGRPSYAMVGSAFATTSLDGVTTHPDLVECYTRGRLCVELWFRDGGLDQHIGYLMPTAWDGRKPAGRRRKRFSFSLRTFLLAIVCWSVFLTLNLRPRYPNLPDETVAVSAGWWLLDATDYGWPFTCVTLYPTLAAFEIELATDFANPGLVYDLHMVPLSANIVLCVMAPMLIVLTIRKLRGGQPRPTPPGNHTSIG